MIFDNVGNHSLSACRRLLNPKGILGGRGILSLLTRLVTALIWSWFMSQKFVFFIAQLNKQDLTLLSELMATGKVTPVIDRCYSLNQVPEAIRYLSEHHARGKVVITLQ
jgi:NADPH:quinone reductase-like Zn-dependent oxidoreductase